MIFLVFATWEVIGGVSRARGTGLLSEMLVG